MNPFRRTSAQQVANLTSKLIDENLMNKYGTSLEINMGREYQKYLDEKYVFLKNEFAKINKNADDVITYDELVDFLKGYENEVNFNLKRLEKFLKMVMLDIYLI